MTSQRSPLARQVPGARDPALGVLRAPWGVCLHTTGRGVVAQAKAEKRRPIDVAIGIYIRSQNGELHDYTWGGPTYVIDHDGSKHQLAPDNIKTAHAGSGNRPAYMSGHWTAKCSGATLSAWRKQWPGFKHPYQLFPSRSPNIDYVGIEIIPCGSGFGQPMRPMLLFTKDQHEAAAELARDIGKRHGFPDGWQTTSRLVGHEDVDILERMDSHGGWDPGFLRAHPYFDFGYVRSAV